MREPIGPEPLAEALVGQHSYAPLHRYASCRRYAPVQPMTRTRPPDDQPVPGSPGALEPPSARPSPSNTPDLSEFEADIEARRAEFDRLIAPLLPQLEAAARALTGSPEDAKDLLQDTEQRAWSYGAVTKCDGNQHRFHSYLLEVMRNCWNTELAKRKTRRVSEPEGEYAVHFHAIHGESAAPRERSELLDLDEHLSRAIARLPPQCRRALGLIRSGKTYQKTAEMMNVDVDTVSLLVSRARRLLKRDLEALGFQLSRTLKRRAKEDRP